MSKRYSILAWGLCAVALGGMVSGAVTQRAVDHAGNESLIEQVGLLVGFASFPVIGALVAARRPENAIGWIFLGIGMAIGLLLPATEYAYYGLVKSPGDRPGVLFAAWLAEWLWFPALAAIPTVGLLLFPDGRPPSRRWNWLVWVSTGLIALVSAGSMFQSHLNDGGYSVANPVGFLPWRDGETALETVFMLLFPMMGLCFASLFVRFRRASSEQRQQLKLLLFAALTFVVAITLGDTFELPEVIFPLVLWMIPGAIGVSILKYRLYDIDLIVNRTLVYVSLSAVLAVMYLGIVVLLQQALGGVTEDSDLAVAGSTLAVAAMFGPLRSRIQAFIDRRFYRRKYDARQTLETFSSRLRDEVDLEHLAKDLTGVVKETMQPAHVSVWLRSPDAVAPQ